MGLGRAGVLSTGTSAQAHGHPSEERFDAREEADPPRGANASCDDETDSDDSANAHSEITGWRTAESKQPGFSCRGDVHCRASAHLCIYDCARVLIFVQRRLHRNIKLEGQFRHRFRMHGPRSQPIPSPTMAALSAINRFSSATHLQHGHANLF